MENQNCQTLIGNAMSSIGNSVRQCSRKAKYYDANTKERYCELHLKKARAFSKNPIEIESGKEIDRHILYKFGKIKGVCL